MAALLAQAVRAGRPGLPLAAGATASPSSAGAWAALDRRGRRGLRLGALLLGLALGRLLRPLLVELDAPLAVLALLERELGAEGPTGRGSRYGLPVRPTPGFAVSRDCAGLHQLLRRRRRAGSCSPSSSRSRSRSPGRPSTSTSSPCGSRSRRGRRSGTGRGWPARSCTPLSLSSSATVSVVNFTMSRHERRAGVLALLDQARAGAPSSRSARAR